MGKRPEVGECPSILGGAGRNLGQLEHSKRRGGYSSGGWRGRCHPVVCWVCLCSEELENIILSVYTRSSGLSPARSDCAGGGWGQCRGPASWRKAGRSLELADRVLLI